MSGKMPSGWKDLKKRLSACHTDMVHLSLFELDTSLDLMKEMAEALQVIDEQFQPTRTYMGSGLKGLIQLKQVLKKFKSWR